ncbi:hypothetical protein TCAL_14498 [Tigriopus californicus]|uniref:Uncharacterized protein n=1 Tax=Tigriopus californicus TaxID=6832 RepID=A0A553PU56_TIGCA|nr:hypothetical protein TCAL_14498 [Tigriopus californicus]
MSIGQIVIPIHSNSPLSGGFNWNLDFFWEWIPARDRARRIRDPTYSFKTPAIAGGAVKTKTCNNRRIAQVWMDSFKAIYDLTLSRAELETECKEANERVKLRSDLKCEPFDWYLDTVYPELQLPVETDLAFGQIHFNQPSFLSCIDNIALGHELGIGANSCLQSYHLQEYRLTKDNLIFHDDFCLSLSALKSGSEVQFKTKLSKMGNEKGSDLWD